LKDIFFPIVGYAFGIVIVSFFSRISGGIFAKAADLGTDMYGKINSQLS
jgi:Na+/H+-translocating membrane pyrophosphatase